MKVFRPRGVSAIVYYIFSLFLILYFIFLIPLIYISDNKIFFDLLPVFVLMDITSVFGIYLLISSVMLKITISKKSLKINGQLIPKRNRIQYPCEVDINSIEDVKAVFDEFNSRGERFASLNPRHKY